MERFCFFRVDQAELALSVWDEDIPDDPQQEGRDRDSSSNKEVQHTGKSQEDLPGVQMETGEEENIITIIITPPHVRNELDQLQGTGGGEDPLLGTSSERDGLAAEGGGCLSPITSVTDNSDEEWKGSVASESEDSSCKAKKRKSPRLPRDRQTSPAKKSKSRVCCKVCGKAFHATVSLVNHTRTHNYDICGVCGEHFETEVSFQDHLMTHVKAEVCNICGKCFGSTRSLEMHLRVHTGEKPFDCSECGKSFNCRHNMMRHIRIHTGEKPYSCTICGKCFSDDSTLKRHLRVHLHEKNLGPESRSSNRIETSNGGDTENDADKSKTPAKKLQARAMCEVCGKMFHSMVPLVNHAKSHATDLCGVCGLHFDSQESLHVHLKTHKNGKVCEVCGKCFDGQGNLETHMRIHTGEKPFLCSECGKSFNCRHNMMRHIRTHTGEKPYQCNVCGRRFSDHSSLKQHSSMHTGEKQHHCPICGKAFHRKTYVRLHMQKHTTKK